MAKAVHQFRFYRNDPSEDRNEPSHSEFEAVGRASGFANGDVFKDYYPFYQLGVQTLPGVMFYLNGSEDPVIVGSTGIYELDLEGISKINNLYFDSTSLKLIADNPNAFLIIDVIYES